ncbi:hypothetical protein Trydic_g6513 [Trypoxylus dichotomus]
MAGEQFSLCWDNFHKNMSSGMHSLLESEDLVDVTLAVDGKHLKAHKMVLSVCSPYFRELFQMNPCKHPIVFMKDVSYSAMNDLLTFMYQGEVQVNQEQLTTFIKTAEALQIKGLTSDGNNDSTEVPEEQPEEPVPTKTVPPPHLAQENEIIPKPTPKTKKPPVSYSTAKRQKISSPTRDKQSPVTVKTDSVATSTPTIEPPAPQTTEQLLQFKMEPYEVDQSDQTQVEGFEENPDDTFADDGADEPPMDETEYNTMLKGEEEPQASTSGDGLGETQADSRQSNSGYMLKVRNLVERHRLEITKDKDGNRKRRRRCVECYKMTKGLVGRAGAIARSRQVSTFCDWQHKLRKMEGPISKVRKRCRECYKRTKAEFDRKFAESRTKKVNTYCENCEGQPVLCKDCFGAIHSYLNHSEAIEEEWL